MLLRLDSLRAIFDEQPPESKRDVQAPSPLDPLLSRLSGLRRTWTKGELRNQLKTQLTSQQKTFKVGEPIPITLDITNTGAQDQKYSHHIVALNGTTKVYDQYGRSVPYVGGTSQIGVRRETLTPGQTAVIQSFDLAAYNYLRKPGKYTVTCRSSSLQFEVTPNPIDDGDLVGKLLPLVHDKWMLVGNPNFKGKVRPGVNFEEVAGQQITFVDNPTGYIGDMELIWLWFTDEKPKPHVQQPDETHPPVSKYFGKVDRWHLYAHFEQRGLKRWPKVFLDVRKALGDPIDTSLDRSDVGPPTKREPAGEEAVRKSVSDADLVVVGKIVAKPIGGVADESGIAHYISQVKVQNVLKGRPMFQGQTILATISRWETAGFEYELPVKKDIAGVLFLEHRLGRKPNNRTTDDRTGIRRSTPQLLTTVKKLVHEETLQKSYSASDLVVSGKIARIRSVLGRKGRGQRHILL